MGRRVFIHKLSQVFARYGNSNQPKKNTLATNAQVQRYALRGAMLR